MKLHIVFFIILSAFTANSVANELVCSMPLNPNTSDMKISYENTTPTSISLKSPKEDEFRQLNVFIETVFERNEKNEESFSVKPIFSVAINWDKEPNCFKEVGTQWYFDFKHDSEDFFVQFIPFFATEYDHCHIPRFKPQTHYLSCTPLEE